MSGFINKVSEGRPHIVDMINKWRGSASSSTPKRAGIQRLMRLSIRANAVQYKIPHTNTISGAQAVVNAIESMKRRNLR